MCHESCVTAHAFSPEPVAQSLYWVSGSRAATHHPTPRNAAKCDGHHEMSDLGAAGEPVHRSGDSVAPVWAAPAIGLGPFGGLKEKDHEQY
jgi:hypothetical protein